MNSLKSIQSEFSSSNVIPTDAQSKQYLRARSLLLEKEHDLTTRPGILEWLASVGYALTHDLPEMPRQKANTAAYVAAVSLKAIQA